MMEDWLCHRIESEYIKCLDYFRWNLSNPGWSPGKDLKKLFVVNYSNTLLVEYIHANFVRGHLSHAPFAKLLQIHHTLLAYIKDNMYVMIN